MRTLFDAVLFQPLMVIYAFLFGLLPEDAGPGPRLIAFSVAINLILLPIYTEMERGMTRRRAIRERVARDTKRMKQHFRGRERYFYIRAVHRQHGHHPISDLLGSADLFIQILVFATVYRYLSSLPSLVGQSFGPIHDLSRPDGLLFGANVLPLLMTAINAAAAFAYIDDRSKRVQALFLGLLFLVLLYRSASGLVLYWTTNNLFSLIRSVAMRSLRDRRPGWMTQVWAQLERQR
jgi:membrane protein insertase Oxa1/YidC/SpoIIIJ